MRYIATVCVNYQGHETSFGNLMLEVFRIARRRASLIIREKLVQLASLCGKHTMNSNKTIRPGETLTVLPDQLDAGVYFVGQIRTPWTTRDVCPKRGDPSGPECRIELDPRWERALEGLAAHPRIEVLDWMHQARRDLLIQVPWVSGKPYGTFALRSPVRPNPIASSVVDLVSIARNIVTVRGLDCLDGTPLIDLKPLRDNLASANVKHAG